MSHLISDVRELIDTFGAPQFPDIRRVDCHVHFGGIIRSETVAACLGEDLNDVRRQMVMDPERDELTLARFLDKFRILNRITWTVPLIEHSLQDLHHFLDDNRIEFCILRLSLEKYAKHLGVTIVQVGKLITDFLRDHEHVRDRLALLLSVKYESDPEHLSYYRDHAAELQELFDGIDLVGDESLFAEDIHMPLVRDWVETGHKAVFAHVTEVGPVDNIRLAMQCGITEMSHGIKVITDPALMDECRRYNIGFHTAITSNYLTGCWDRQAKHPLVTMLERDLRATWGTDDPVQCDVSFDGELGLLVDNANVHNRFGHAHRSPLSSGQTVSPGEAYAWLASTNAVHTVHKLFPGRLRGAVLNPVPALLAQSVLGRS
jgi:hypothetical protein